MMQGNPYGAVPEALKETRLTLRDLMAGHLENKVAEGRLSLAKTQAETETAMVGANLKKEEMVNLRDMARLTQQRNLAEEERAARAGEFEVTSGHARDTLAHQVKTQELQTKIQADAAADAKARTGIAAAAEKRAAGEAAIENEIKPAGEWARMAGVSPKLFKFLDVPADKPYTRRDAKIFQAGLQAKIKEHPSVGVITEQGILKEELTDMQAQLADQKLTLEQRVAIEKTFLAKIVEFEFSDKVIMADKKDPALIVKHATDLYYKNIEAQTKYPDINTFITEYSDNVDKYRSEVQKDLKKFKAAITDKDAPINAEIDNLGTVVAILPLPEQKRIHALAAAGRDPESKLKILKAELKKVAQPRGKTTTPDAALSLMTGQSAPKSAMDEVREAEAAQNTERVNNLLNIVGSVVTYPGRKIAEVREARTAAENAEAERLKGLGKTPVEIGELLKKWRANRL